MKRSEAIVKLTRMYHIRHVMVEGGYITPQDFMTEVLTYMEHLGMLPPDQNANEEPPCAVLTEWEPE